MDQQIVKIRKYSKSTPVIAVPSSFLDKIGKISDYWRVTVEHDALVYRPLIFAAANGCALCDHKEGTA